MRLVVALGGNALLRRGESLEMEVQRGHARNAARALAPLAREHTLLLTHGNGPQVGLLALQAEALAGAASVGLDVLGAESEGMIGYLLEQELQNALPGREIAVLLTQVEVAADDPAFEHPSKPIGPVYTRAQAEALRRERGFVVAPDGAGWRRVVPSPKPTRIRELRTINRLLDAAVLVVCSGGGGIPVVAGPDGALRGAEAVIDKDRSAALLARGVDADGLLLLTDAPGVYADFGGPQQRLLRQATPAELRALTLDPGSMGPKAEAVCEFVENCGGFAVIGALEQAAALLDGRAGTRVELAPLSA